MQNNNSLEREIQLRFMDIIKNQKENITSNSYKVYQKLVFYRYEEIIKNTFAQFIKHISVEELEDSIYEFLKNPPETQFVWKIANDYRKFVKKNDTFINRVYLYELLYFEWIEMELLMKEYKEKEESIFSWTNSYKLSISARIKKFNYDVIGTNYEELRENFLIIYFDFSNNEVLYREINQFIYVLIKKLKEGSLEEILNKLCLENDIELTDAKNILEEPLKELILNKALTGI
ncbi:MAG: hypothetical protein RBR65_08880 [Aliarcobacter sp.]|jgi:hypothetical protein|nr:hypothetical protein [Aliarcobacter sp.]